MPGRRSEGRAAASLQARRRGRRVPRPPANCGVSSRTTSPIPTRRARSARTRGGARSRSTPSAIASRRCSPRCAIASGDERCRRLLTRRRTFYQRSRAAPGRARSARLRARLAPRAQPSRRVASSRPRRIWARRTKPRTPRSGPAATTSSMVRAASRTSSPRTGSTRA